MKNLQPLNTNRYSLDELVNVVLSKNIISQMPIAMGQLNSNEKQIQISLIIPAVINILNADASKKTINPTAKYFTVFISKPHFICKKVNNPPRRSVKSGHQRI